MSKHMLVNGDSNHPVVKDVRVNNSKATVNAYKAIRIGHPVGTPTVKSSQIVQAVRKVMKEDGMIK
jgi:hypothetical protein